MRTIEMVTDTLHGRDRFVEGEVRHVNESLAHYFVRHGWARYTDSPEENDTVFNTVPDGPADLEIDDIQHESTQELT